MRTRGKHSPFILGSDEESVMKVSSITLLVPREEIDIQIADTYKHLVIPPAYSFDYEISTNNLSPISTESKYNQTVATSEDGIGGDQDVEKEIIDFESTNQMDDNSSNVPAARDQTATPSYSFREDIGGHLKMKSLYCFYDDNYKITGSKVDKVEDDDEEMLISDMVKKIKKNLKGN
ncbi:hypothetical protein QYF36_024752 [Acer negundo]|nr:hypothetical protein QYF36_024752 [Acer negundo]